MSRDNSLLCASGTLNGIELEIRSGSVLNIDAGTIVNAANEHLQNNGGLAAQIVHDGGREIQEECDTYIRTYGDLRIGSVAVTKGWRLKYNKILHVVGPKLNDREIVSFNHRDLLVKAVFNCMVKADELNIESIGIPAISCGIYMFPIKEASICHIEAFISYAGMYVWTNSGNVKLKKVIFSLWKEDELDCFLSAFMEKWQAFDYVNFLGNRKVQNLPKIEYICDLCDYNYENEKDFLSASHNHPFRKTTCNFCLMQNQLAVCNVCQGSYSEEITQLFYSWILCRNCKNLVASSNAHSCRQWCYNCFHDKNRGKEQLEMKCLCGAFPYKEQMQQMNQQYRA